MKILSRSIREEVIGLLWLILAFVARPYIEMWLFYVLAAMGIMDMILSIKFALLEILKNKEQQNT